MGWLFRWLIDLLRWLDCLILRLYLLWRRSWSFICRLFRFLLGLLQLLLLLLLSFLSLFLFKISLLFVFFHWFLESSFCLQNLIQELSSKLSFFKWKIHSLCNFIDRSNISALHVKKEWFYIFEQLFKVSISYIFTDLLWALLLSFWRRLLWRWSTCRSNFLLFSG